MKKKRPPGEIKEIPIDLIRPGSQQARRHFDPDALRELAESIRESGVVQPVVLRTRVWGYELLAGERRWRRRSPSCTTFPRWCATISATPRLSSSV
jgi:ParB family transcriptional regulator, chromosome partitioning protein